MKVYPLFPCYAFSRPAEKVNLDSDLIIERIAPSAQAMGEIIRIDNDILGFHREAEHAWLLENRQGYFYKRNKNIVGYGYLGEHNGPFASLDANDFPAILAHAETEAADKGTEFSVEVPMVNRAAVDHLLRRGCRLELFFEFFMADSPFGKFRELYSDQSPVFCVSNCRLTIILQSACHKHFSYLMIKSLYIYGWYLREISYYFRKSFCFLMDKHRSNK